MDFSNCGALEVKGAVQRAHVQWSDNGAKRNIRGPFRIDEKSAQEDLQTMRAAASRMSREDGFAAMETKAQHLREGKAPREDDRAKFHWRNPGTHCNASGPPRAEKRRAEEDLEALREASVGHAAPAARRAALAAEAHRLQQLAEREVARGTCTDSCPRTSTAAAPATSDRAAATSAAVCGPTPSRR